MRTLEQVNTWLSACAKWLGDTPEGFMRESSVVARSIPLDVVETVTGKYLGNMHNEGQNPEYRYGTFSFHYNFQGRSQILRVTLYTY